MARHGPDYTTWSYTAPTVEQDEVDRERAALSEEERRQIDDDLYGKYEPAEETPQIIADKIEEMRHHIDEIPDDEKESYLVAQEKCTEYCNSVLFQIMFLRAEKLDAEKAASRLVAYWEDKLDLFGPERTYHRISMDDLTADLDDADLLKSGAFYPLPEKDEGGRAVLLINRSNPTLSQVGRASKLRVLLYMFHCMLEDDESTQKKGVVLLFTPPRNVSLMQAFDRKYLRRFLRMERESLPCSIAARHTVVPDVSYVVVIYLPVVYQLLGKENRQRLVVHNFQQSMLEVAKDFKEYGINAAVLPIDLGGGLDFDHDAWLDQRRAIEAAREGN